jgi:hypothetical protein
LSGLEVMAWVKRLLSRLERSANRWAATHGAPYVTRQGWVIVAAVFLCFAAVTVLGLWTVWHAWSHLPHSAEGILTWDERRSPTKRVFVAVSLLALNASAACLYLLGRSLREGRLNFPIVKVVTIYGGTFAALQIVGHFLTATFAHDLFVRHPLYFDIAFRTDVVIVLTAFAVFLYWFKSKAKMFYGFTEIVIGILSNLTLIGHLDISHFPRLILTTQDIIAFGAFTYLLSRGVSNVMEGAVSYRQRLENIFKESVLAAQAEEDKAVANQPLTRLT